MLASSTYTPCLCWRWLVSHAHLSRPELRATLCWRELSLRVQRCFSTRTDSTLETHKNDAVVQKGQLGDIGQFKAEKKPRLSEPLVPNLFLGKLDPIFLVYPQVSKEELSHLHELIAPIDKFFDSLDSKSIDETAKIPDQVLQQVKDFGLFGLQIPEQYGGLNLNAVEYARVIEIIARDGSIAVTLAAHQTIGLKAILLAGTEEQKQRYLPRLATGEHIAAFCLTEPSSGSDAASIQSKATLSEDGRTWHLTGSKLWISNGGIADVFTVFAKTDVSMTGGETKQKMTAFIVERAFGGVSNGKPEDKLGIRGSNTCEVHFDNTPVPAENVIGQVGDGFKIAMQVLNTGRFSMGSGGAGILKLLIGLTAEHATRRSQFGHKLAEFGLIQEKLAHVAVTAYAMESMAYLTAGLLDTYDNPDLSVEAAIVKVLGGLGYMKDYPYERYLRDSRILLIFEGTNEILRLFVALQSLKYAGRTLKEHIKRLRNPLENPTLMVKAVWNRARGKTVRNLQPLHLDHDVHQQLEKEAKILDAGIVGLAGAVEDILSEFGNKVVDEQMKLRRLADIAVDLYAMTACIGRASRSLIIGLRNADHEVMMTRSFCYLADQRIKRNLYELTPSKRSGIAIDDINRQIAETIFKVKGYAAEHALSRNW